MWQRRRSGHPTSRRRTQTTPAPTQARAPARRRREYITHTNNPAKPNTARLPHTQQQQQQPEHCARNEQRRTPTTSHGTTQAAPGQHSKQPQPPQQQQPQQRIQDDNRKTIPTPAPNPDNITAAQPRQTPSRFHPCNRKPGRRVITWFSGYDGFREAAIVHEPKWQVVGGTEGVLSDKGRRIATLWEDDNPGGRILGHHGEVQQRL